MVLGCVFAEGLVPNQVYAATPEITVGDTITFGKYEQDNDTANGKEPIEWQVLDKKNNQILVISKYILNHMSYGQSTWDTCFLHTWLNGYFLNEAFDQSEKAAISTVTVTADKNPAYPDTPVGSDTSDKVFLLSVVEAQKYFNNYWELRCAGTKYSGVGNEYYKTASGENAFSWWLRTPGSNGSFATYVERSGSINIVGTYSESGSMGVRPALWINCNSSVSLPVKAKSILNATVTGVENIAWTGNNSSLRTQSPTVKVDGVTLKEGTDYTLSYINNTSPGTATMVICGIGEYSGTMCVDFSITWDISDATVTGVEDKDYTGSAITQKPTVYKFRVLDEGTDYTVSYENNTNVGTATMIITGNGHYSGTKRVNFDILGSGFQIGRDNNSFTNGNYPGGGFEEVETYFIDPYYQNRLLKNSNKGEKDKILTHMDEQWGGSCYGIAMTMGLVYEGYIKLSDLTDTGSTSYYSLPKPKDDKKLRNCINYYQLSQFLEKGGRSEAISKTFGNKWSSVYSGDNLPSFLKNLVETCSNNRVLLFGYTYPGEKEEDYPGHAVLITGCVFDTENNKFRVTVYDENKPEEYGYMFIERDFSGFEYNVDIGNRILEIGSIYLYLYFLDCGDSFSEMPHISVSNRNDRLSTTQYTDGSKESGGSNHTRIIIPLGKRCRIINNDGRYLFYDGTSLSGDLPVYDLDAIIADRNTSIVIETDNSSKLTFSDLGKTADVSVVSKDNYIAFSGEAISQAVIDNGLLKITGNNFNYRAVMSSSGDNGPVSVSAKARSSVEISNKDENISVNSDKILSNVKVKTYTGTKVKQREYSNVKPAFIVDNDAMVNSGTEIVNPTKEKVNTRIGLSAKTATVYEDASAVITLPKKTKATVKSSKSSIASVKYTKKTGKILITGKKAGKATISVKVGKITEKIAVTVKSAPLTISSSNVTVKAGKKDTVTTVKKKNIKVTSSNNKIATAKYSKSTGKITIQGKKKGKATITVRNGKASKKIKVTVKGGK